MKKFAGVLLKQNNEFVLQHRDDKPGIYLPGLYHIWGGAVEGDESIEAAAVRELHEETGVVINESQLSYLTTYEWSRDGTTRQSTIYLVAIDNSVDIHCYEGQGIVKVYDLSMIPDDKNSHPLVEAQKAIMKIEAS